MSETSSEWYECFLKASHPDKKFVVGEFSNGQTVWICGRDVTFSPNAHVYCLPEQTSMFVRVEPNDKGCWNQWRAVECQIHRDVESEPAEEQGEIEFWRGNCGSIRRPCGCNIFAKVGEKPKDGYLFNAGDRVSFTVSYSEFKKNYVATELKHV